MVFPAKMGQAPNWEAPLNDLGPLLSCFTPLVCFRKLVKNLRRPQGQGRTLTTFLKKFSTPSPALHEGRKLLWEGKGSLGGRGSV